MKVLVDMDGCTTNFVSGAMRLHNKPWPYDDPVMQGPAGWDIYKHWGMSPADFWSGMGYEFWSNLDPYPWAAELVDLAKQAVGSENVAFCTSPAHQPGCIEGKIDWCKAFFPDVPVVITRAVRGQPAPKHFLAHPDVILIDDYDKNVDTFIEHGGRAILFPMPWNTQHVQYQLGNSLEAVICGLKIAVPKGEQNEQLV